MNNDLIFEATKPTIFTIPFCCIVIAFFVLLVSCFFNLLKNPESRIVDRFLPFIFPFVLFIVIFSIVHEYIGIKSDVWDLYYNGQSKKITGYVENVTTELHGRDNDIEIVSFMVNNVEFAILNDENTTYGISSDDIDFNKVNYKINIYYINYNNENIIMKIERDNQSQSRQSGDG